MMTDTAIPVTYADWKHCITVLCGIPLTADYIDSRLSALANSADHTTQRFIEVWGEAHLAQVTDWFHAARNELRQ
ncbi:MAG: hypothetical protein AAGD40_01235 [Pseudomonadota bacterium]